MPVKQAGAYRAGWLLAALLWFGAAGGAAAAEPGLDAMGPVARAQIAALIAEKEARTPVEQKIDPRLLRAIDAALVSPRYPILNSLARRDPDGDGKVAVDIDVFDGQADGVVAMLQSAGAEVHVALPRFRMISARVRFSTLHDIAAHPGVRFVSPPHDGGTFKVDTSEGDAAHQANAARSTFGYTGAGQKVCVISNGINTLLARQASGDVPWNVEVLPGQEGNGDEGTAMLEIVHDLAPGATLGFAGGLNPGGSLPQMVQNILDLADPTKGKCTIIVDDIFYNNEPPFSDGILAHAINTVTAAGVLYFSAAGNGGSFDAGTAKQWEGDFNSANNLTSALIPGHILHEFAPNVGDNPALGTATIAVLGWAEPNAGSGSDYDLYVLDAGLTAVIGSGTRTQNGTQDPIEFAFPSGANFPVGSRLVVAKKTGAPNRMLHVRWQNGRLTYTTTGAMFHHAIAADAFAVAAVNASAVYPGAFTAANTVETFSSDGPRRMFFDYFGNTLPGAPAGNMTSTGGIVRNKPDISAADGVSTSAPGFATFFGTSAAAPHAAAIAALVKQAAPTFTPAQIRSVLTGSALNLYGPGWDRNSGYGIVMPAAALQMAMVQQTAGILLGSVTPAEVNGNGNGLVDSGEDWKLDIVLDNIGGVTATSLVATLASNTPGVVVTSPPVSYANLAAHTSAVNPLATPFRFTVFDIPCGEPLKFTLSVTSAQGAQPVALKFFVTSALTLGMPQTFSYTGPGAAIPDGLFANVSGPDAIFALPVSGVIGNVGDVKLRIDGLNNCSPNDAANAGIDHSYVGDLMIEVMHPDATPVKAINRIGDAGVKGPNLCNVTLDDAAGTGNYLHYLTSASAPFAGTWLPWAPLSAFRGKPANGLWQLRATDWYNGDTGHVNRFSLIISPQACVRSTLATVINATKTVTGSFMPGGTVTYTVTLTNIGNGVQADLDGNEYVEMLPAQLTANSGLSSATSGSMYMMGNQVGWNGAIDAGASVTLTIVATVNAGTEGQGVISQGTVNFDINHIGINTNVALTDDPGVAGSANPTVFVVGGGPVTDVGDIDLDGVHGAPTDGVLIIRYLLGFTGTQLVQNATGALSNRSDPDEVLAYLLSIHTQLDIDLNGQSDALTDGVLIARYLLGLRGAALIAGALGQNANRMGVSDIEAYLATLFPP